MASILSDIKYKQVALDNIKNPLPTNIDEANNRVLQETQAENVRRVNRSMSILPEKTIRFFKGIAKKLNNRGVSYSATITNNGHNTMLRHYIKTLHLQVQSIVITIFSNKGFNGLV